MSSRISQMQEVTIEDGLDNDSLFEVSIPEPSSITGYQTRSVSLTTIADAIGGGGGGAVSGVLNYFFTEDNTSLEAYEFDVHIPAAEIFEGANFNTLTALSATIHAITGITDSSSSASSSVISLAMTSYGINTSRQITAFEYGADGAAIPLPYSPAPYVGVDNGYALVLTNSQFTNVEYPVGSENYGDYLILSFAIMCKDGWIPTFPINVQLHMNYTAMGYYAT